MQKTQHRIPFILVTGFLGSGKTTFINQILHHLSNKKVLVVENELGEVNFDSGMLSQAYQIQEISNGCLCCVSQNEWLSFLETIPEREPDLVLIEASGAADPAGILAPFFQIPQLAEYFSFQQTISLVDAFNWDISRNYSALTARQLALSDTFVFSRIEEISPEQQLQYTENLKAINPLARIFTQEKEDRPLDLILQPPMFGLPKTWDIQAHETFQAHLISTEKALDFLLFQNWLNMLMKMSDRVYRIKGILTFQGFEHPLMVQAAGKYFSFHKVENPPAHLLNQTIWIGKNLDPQAIQKQLLKF